MILAGIIGKKLGMTQVFSEDGSSLPVTVIEAGPCTVTAVRKAEQDGYDAIQLAFGEVDLERLSRPAAGHLRKAGSAVGARLIEFRDELDRGIGDQVTVEGFEKGQKVSVSGRTKGKGFQGTVKRHNFSRGPVTHGSHNVRAPGSIGASATPSRVFKGRKMPGQMGDARVTQGGVEVVEVDLEKNLLLLKGAVPGAKGSVVEVRSDG